MTAHRLLAEVGLAERGGSLISGYSRGMRQRLGIARALINDPQVVFLDEEVVGGQNVQASVPAGYARPRPNDACEEDPRSYRVPRTPKSPNRSTLRAFLPSHMVIC